MRIYVGNLNYQTTLAELVELFFAIGPVEERLCTLLKDETGASKGTAFIEMFAEADGKYAIAQLNGMEFAGRQIKVDVAKPRENRGGPPRGSGNRGERYREVRG